MINTCLHKYSSIVKDFGKIVTSETHTATGSVNECMSVCGKPIYFSLWQTYLCQSVADLFMSVCGRPIYVSLWQTYLCQSVADLCQTVVDLCQSVADLFSDVAEYRNELSVTSKIS